MSPDGRWLAYESNESGRSEIYVRPFPDVDAGRWQVSTTSGGIEPVWAGSGRELFYRSGAALMTVPIQTDPGFAAGTPEVLFEGQEGHYRAGQQSYDVSPDSERFLMMKEGGATDDASAAAQIIVVLQLASQRSIHSTNVPTPSTTIMIRRTRSLWYMCFAAARASSRDP